MLYNIFFFVTYYGPIKLERLSLTSCSSLMFVSKTGAYKTFQVLPSKLGLQMLQKEEYHYQPK